MSDNPKRCSCEYRFVIGHRHNHEYVVQGMEVSHFELSYLSAIVHGVVVG